MELKRYFSRNIEKHQLRYVKYLGDGDSKSFSNIEKVYDNTDVEKFECVGHVQKRIGIRLRDLKKKHKWMNGKLTDKMIDRFVNYHGIALSFNLESVASTKKAIFASFLNVGS